MSRGYEPEKVALAGCVIGGCLFGWAGADEAHAAGVIVALWARLVW